MPRLIALDLGAHSVKAATYRLPARGLPELEELFSQVVPQDGVVPSLAQRLVALDALLDDHPSLRPASSDQVLLAWPSSDAAFHRLQVPFTDRAQIERTLPFTLESEVPFDLDTMALGWRIIATSPGRTDVMAALARRERLRDWLNGVVERGFDPTAVHVDAELFGPWGGVAPVLVEQDAAPAPLIAVLDVGHAHTTVSVLRDGVVQSARSFNSGGLAVTKAIADALSVPWAEAEAIKHGLPVADAVWGDDEPTQDAAAPPVRVAGQWPAAAVQRVQGVLSLFLAEVRSTLIQAEDALGGEVAEVRLTGGGARLAQLRSELHRDLGVPVVDALDPREGIAGEQYSVVRALGGAVGSAQVADLRVGELAYRGHIDFVRAALGYGAIGAACFAVAALVMFTVQYRSFSVQQAETEEAIRRVVTRSFPDVPESTLQSVSMAKSLMTEMTRDAEQRALVLGEAGGVPPTLDTLYALTRAFPPHPKVRVELSELTISPTSISFNAETDGFAGSAAVEESLKANERFRTATKGDEQKLTNGHIRFPVTITLGDEDEGETVTGDGKEG